MNTEQKLIIIYFLLMMAFFLILATPFGHAQQPTAIIVNSTDDPGTQGDDYITLREAILFATGKAKATGGELSFVPANYGNTNPDVIQFDTEIFKPNTPVRIFLIQAEPLSLDTGQDTIDGSNAGIIIDGINCSGIDAIFNINSNGNCIKGLQIVNSPRYGIVIRSGNNVIGGDRALGKGPLGEGNQIGGSKDTGILITDGGSNNTVLGNLVGVDVTGNKVMGNLGDGIVINTAGSGHIIGGKTNSTCNVVSGNMKNGIALSQTNNTKVIGNYIGVDITGETILKNGIAQEVGAANGIVINRCHDIVIGGSEPGEANLIIGNEGAGLQIYDGVESTQILGNIILNNQNGFWIFGSGEGMNFGDVRSLVIQGNVIGSNDQGITLFDGVYDTLCSENYIGITKDGKNVPNKKSGIGIQGAIGTIIGPNNIISRNIGAGIGVSNYPCGAKIT